MQQLSELNTKESAVIVGSENWQIDVDNPGFLSLRLLEPPRSAVRVLCAPDLPSVMNLSRSQLEFTAENYNIEQTIRCDVLGEATNVFCSVLVQAESKDPQIHGSFAKRPFLLNYNDNDKLGFGVTPLSLTLKDQSYIMCKPEGRPVDFVTLQIFQNGVETASVDFSPRFYGEFPICLFPTKAALQEGECRLTLKASSKDRRFNNFQREFVLKIDVGNVNIPDIKVVSPPAGGVIKGPDFVSCEAVVEGAQEASELSLFCGKKRLGMIQGTRLQSPVEMGPPQSRLLPGTYPLWAAVRLKSGLVVATDVRDLTVTKE